MAMVDLVVTVCLLSDPSECRKEHLYFETSGDLRRCMFLAQPELAKWAAYHPNFSIKRWSCEYPDPSKEI